MLMVGYAFSRCKVEQNVRRGTTIQGLGRRVRMRY